MDGFVLPEKGKKKIVKTRKSKTKRVFFAAMRQD